MSNTRYLHFPHPDKPLTNIEMKCYLSQKNTGCIFIINAIKFVYKRGTKSYRTWVLRPSQGVQMCIIFHL